MRGKRAHGATSAVSARTAATKDMRSSHRGVAASAQGSPVAVAEQVSAVADGAAGLRLGGHPGFAAALVGKNEHARDDPGGAGALKLGR
jgi:hypothetical protein